ncbi:MAG: tetratricopeptide repeat protein [Verrucomicrobiales bacterium]
MMALGIVAASAAYATASHATVFVSGILAFMGLGLSLALMLRPKSCVLCIWSLAIFSLAWLIESTTHLLGVGGHVELGALKWGIWLAVGLFGLGLACGILGVLAYQRNEHKYERGLVVGVFAALLNLWVVGGIVTAWRKDRLVVLGRGMVIPMMGEGGPVDGQALAAAAAKLSERPEEDTAMKMAAMLGRVVADLSKTLAGGGGGIWQLESEEETAKAANAGGALRKIHPDAQHRLSLATEPGWMSMSISEVQETGDPLAAAVAQADAQFEAHLLSLMPQRRLRAVRTNHGGFEIVQTSTHASILGFADSLVFHRWVAVGGSQALEIWACAPEATDEFYETTRAFVVGVIRQLQHQGLAGPKYSAAVIALRESSLRLEWENRFPDALAGWRQAALDTPRDPEVQVGIARCAWKLGQVPEAAEWFDSIPPSADEPMSVRLSRGRMRAATGDLEARQALATSFEEGVADDETLSALLFSFVSADERPAAAAALAAFAPRHGAPLMAWWQAYLAPPAPASAEEAPAANTPSTETQATEPKQKKPSAKRLASEKKSSAKRKSNHSPKK